MPQSYADRVARRPGYARYKNRKKLLREKEQRGWITAGERQILQDRAKRIYLNDPDGDYIHQYLTTNAPRGGCNRACLVAAGDTCECLCDGRHHGTLRRGHGIA